MITPNLPDPNQILSYIPFLDKFKELFNLLILLTNKLFTAFEGLFLGIWGIIAPVFEKILQFIIDFVQFLIGKL